MRALAALTVVAALLAGYLWLGDRRRPAADRGSPARLLPAFDRAGVRRITLARAGAQPFSLDREPPGRSPAWRVDPGQKPADDAAVEDLLNALDLAEADRTADLTPAAAGLDPPALVAELATGGAPVKLRLGKIDAAGAGVFARVENERAVQVVPRHLFDVANREPSAFRDRRLIPVAIEAVTSIEWRVGGGEQPHRLQLVGGRWQNERDEWVAGERVVDSLRRLLGLRVDRFLGPSGGRAAVLDSVDLAAGDETKVGLRFGETGCGPPEATFVSREGSQDRDDACLSTERLREVWPSLQAARAPDARLLSSPPEATTRVEVADGARRLVLARTLGGPWRFDFPRVPYAVDGRAVEDWLRALGQAQIAPVSWRSGTLRRLLVEARYREVVSVPERSAAYALLDPDPLRFRDRAVLDFAHFDALGLRRVAAGEAVEMASDAVDGWRVVSPAGAAADRANTARVIGALGNLRAEQFLSVRPARPRTLSLQITVAAPGDTAPARHTLDLYDPGAGKPCTIELDRTAVFTVSRAACDELRLSPLAHRA
jgi:hypothetical protein